MFTIKPLNKIDEKGLNRLPNTNFKIDDNAENPDGVILRSFSMHDMEMPTNLLAVARAGAGVNNIPLDKCGEKGIVVFNSPGANANAVKELVITGLLLSCRKVLEGIEWTKTLSGENVAKDVESGKGNYIGPELFGKTLGVVGLGAIGKLIANTCVALGMNVIGYDPYFSGEIDKSVEVTADLDELYAKSDFITLHLPYTEEMRHFIKSDPISKMKDGVKILNFARGELVCSYAINKALESGKVAKYVVDFPVDELIGKDGIIAIPHLGASTPEAEENCAIMAADELREYLENGNIINSVNYPNCKIDSEKQNRVCVIYKTDGGTLDKINKEISGTIQMASNEKNDFGYAMFDLKETIADIDKTLQNIENVIKVRIL